MPDPQETPDEQVGLETGQSPETQDPVPAVEPAAANEVTEKLTELEKQNRDLQRRLTQQGRELADQRRSSSQPAPEQTGTFWDNPEGVITAKLAEFEERQEQRRQTAEMLRNFADEKGIPVRDLQRLDGELRGAAADPQEYLSVLARLRDAERTADAVRSATEQAVKTVQGNARAVTTEGGAVQPASPEKSVEDMTLDEYRATLVKKYGEVPLE